MNSEVGMWKAEEGAKCRGHGAWRERQKVRRYDIDGGMIGLSWLVREVLSSLATKDKDRFYSNHQLTSQPIN